MPTKMHYLDHASMGRSAPRTIKRVRDAVAALGNFQSGGTPETLLQFEAVEKARKRVARAINAKPGQILFVGNTSQALGTIATALPLQRGDQILLADVEFMGAPLVWRGVCERVGVELVPVRTRGGRVLPDDFRAAIGPRARVISISTVQEVSGFRADIPAIREIADTYGTFVIADGIQEAGARPVDFAAMGADAYCAGGHKWLRSPFGLGFACLGERLLNVLRPTFQGYFAMGDPEIGWAAYMALPNRTPFDTVDERRDAGRLEMGGYPNWLGAVALDAAVEEWLHAGPAKVWASILKLRKRLTDGLKELDLRVLSTENAPEKEFAGIVTFCLPGGIEDEKKLVAELERNRIYVSVRYISGVGGIRTGVHVTNTSSDIDAFLNVTERFVSKTKKSKPAY
jgi:selenocysteine lyase/cysteine desulfurase